jgi:hypothetical protein
VESVLTLVLLAFTAIVAVQVLRGSSATTTSDPMPDEGAPAPAYQEPGGASLFEKPDQWSRVVRQLPEDTIVTFGGADGQFLRVTTADDVVGYVLKSACISDPDGKGPTGHA